MFRINTNVPEKEKNEEYHKKAVLSICNGAFNSEYELMNDAINACYEYYDGTQTNEAFRFVQESEAGNTLPARWMNFNKIKTKIDVLIGELIQKDFNIAAQAQNKEAKSRKLEQKYKELAKLDIVQTGYELEDMTGMPFAPENPMESEEEVNEYFEKNYKDVAEEVITSVLKYLTQRYKWDYERVAIYRDVLIAGRGFAKCEIVEGIPKWRRIDPRYVVFDTFSTDDFLTDSTFWGEVRYMSLSEVTHLFNLSKEEVEKIKGMDTSKLMDRKMNNSQRFKFVDAASQKIMVFYGYWQDTKVMKAKVSVDKFGNEHFKRVSEKEKGDDIVSRKIKVWRKCTLIGGEIVKDFGIMENMVRSIDDIADTLPPYLGVIPNYVNYKGVSKVEQLKTLQDLKDLIWYQIQLAMSRAGAKGFVYDVSQCPDEYTPEQVIEYIKVAGIAFINSKKDGIPSQYTAFNEFDMTLSNSVNQYINLSAMVDSEMERISGINDARQGIIGSANQAVGVTQNALAQSALSTASISYLFDLFTERVMTYIANLSKLCIDDIDKWGPIIGDSAVKYIQSSIDIALQDYAVFIKSVPPLIQDKAQLQKTLDVALQQGAVSLPDYLRIVRESDVNTAIDRFIKLMDKKEKENKATEVAMQQQQQMMAQQAMLEKDQQTQEYLKEREEAKGKRQLEVEEQRSINRTREKIIDNRLNS